MVAMVISTNLHSRRDDVITVMGTEVENAHSVLYGCIVSNDANSNEVCCVRFLLILQKLLP